MAGDQPDDLPTSAPDARLSSLDQRLRHAERVEGERRPTVDAAANVRSSGVRALQSLVGMPIGGAIIGWLLDRVFGTPPWVMLGLMFVGFAGAIIDMMRNIKSSTTDSGK